LNETADNALVECIPLVRVCRRSLEGPFTGVHTDGSTAEPAAAAAAQQQRQQQQQLDSQQDAAASAVLDKLLSQGMTFSLLDTWLRLVQFAPISAPRGLELLRSSDLRGSCLPLNPSASLQGLQHAASCLQQRLTQLQGPPAAAAAEDEGSTQAAAVAAAAAAAVVAGTGSWEPAMLN
jgi:hypothetical protein